MKNVQVLQLEKTKVCQNYRTLTKTIYTLSMHNKENV